MDLLNKIFSGTQVRHISAVDAQHKLAQNPKPFLLDVRQPEEFRAGHIPGALLIPLGELTARMQELPRNQEILVVCRSGNRSTTATRQLSGAGFSAVNLSGGMIAWSGAGFPVSRGK